MKLLVTGGAGLIEFVFIPMTLRTRPDVRFAGFDTQLMRTEPGMHD